MINSLFDFKKNLIYNIYIKLRKEVVEIMEIKFGKRYYWRSIQSGRLYSGIAQSTTNDGLIILIDTENEAWIVPEDELMEKEN